MARVLIGNVKGPKGDTGSKGDTGATGAQGPAGTPGVTDYASTSRAGLVRAGDDFNVNASNGVLSIKGEFTKASTLQNLVSGEAHAVTLGKIAKAIDQVVENEGDIADEAAARQAQIEAITTNRKYVLIGDSYGMRNTPNWVSLFQQVCGSNVIHADARSSHGFATGTLTFLAILTDAVNALTEDERNSVTDIVVVGGWNDARWIKQGGTASGLQNAIKTFCQYAEQNFPNAVVTVEFCGWQLATGIQDNVLRSHLVTARTIYDGTWQSNLRHGSSMFKVMLNPFVYDSSGFHPNDSTGANNLFYALLNDITGSGQFYYFTGTIPTTGITMGSGISATVSVRRFTQIDGFVRLELTFSNVTGLGNGNTLCTFNLSSLPFSLWGSQSFFGNVLNGNPLYCILNTDGSLKVYGASASFTSGMTFVIRETFPMIINE